ncbi:MAG: NADH-quinone oxidoreductase subunit NuoG [Magnetococcales bacterium]|nr:NADH-quinone oxidoreductase subunit NuoG [Magnetococcales bacterium]MBF0115104.1 NADH-quinone oxidoreductase subunit NuoG [Magnetococcales bacterium]
MPTLIIDGKEISVQPGATIMEAARLLGVYIPHFCYHPQLSIAGNCRMCLVEVEKMPRPVVSCAMPVSEGMVVKTDSDMVRKGRQAVMEFLLINHPLDCPVCDQGGECTLQDLAMKYGPDRSRYHEHKRHAHDYDLGPLLETEMNRCIHCTRCIRFTDEVAGTSEMGAIYRGDHMQVGPYTSRPLSSELTGNLAELCPVGALNNKPFHFQARGWELKKSDTVCGHCAVGCQQRVDHLNDQIKRVMARRCLEINQTWLCDKGRFAYDGLTRNRLEQPLLRSEENNRLMPVSWVTALDRAAELLKRFKPEEVAGLASEAGQGAEELYAFQDFLRNVVGTAHLDHRLRQRDFSADEVPLTRADLAMNTSLSQLAKADLILLIGFEPRYETPLLNVRLRQATLNGARAFAVQPRRMHHSLANLTQIVVRPGAEVAYLNSLLQELQAEGIAQSELAVAWKAAKQPVVLLGNYAIVHPQAEAMRRAAVALLEQARALGGQWNGFNRVAGRGNAAAAQDLGVVPHRGPGYRRLERHGRHAQQILQGAANGEIRVLLLLGCDPTLEGVDTALARAALSKCVVIYVGAVETAAAAMATVVLPGLTNNERPTTLTNVEGRAQRSAMAVMGPVQAKEDWRIFRALSDRFAKPLPYNTREALRAQMAAVDHRYALDNLEAGELTAACDHKPVTTGLPLAADGMGGSGLLLVVEPAHFQDDAVTRQSTILSQLTLGRTAPLGALRINPQDAGGAGIQEGQKVRLICGDRQVECVASLDESVPAQVVFGDMGQGGALLQDLCSWESGFPQVSLVGL